MIAAEAGTASQHPGGVLAAASLAQMAVVIDFYALNVALPDMAADLGVTATELQWVISGYMVALAACFIAAGRIGDVFGRKKTLIVGTAIFGITSAIAGATSNVSVLVVVRILQGIGAAAMWPVGVAMVTNAFPAARVQRALGILFSFGALGTAVSPIVGGVVSEFASWRLVRWINVPIAVVVIILAVVSARDSRDETVPRKIDYPGLVLITGGLFVTILAIDQATSWGWTSPLTLGVLAVGIVAIIAFFFVESRAEFPLVDVALVRRRLFLVITAGGAVANIAFATTIYMSTLFLQNVKGLSAAQAGIVFLAMSVGAASAGLVSGRLERFEPRWILFWALAIGGAAVVALSRTDMWGVYLTSFVFIGFGLGLGWAYATVGTQAVVRPERAGEASGVTMTVLVAAGGVAVAIASAILASATGGSAERAAINDILFVVGVFAIVGGAVMPVVGRVSADKSALASSGPAREHRPL